MNPEPGPKRKEFLFFLKSKLNQILFDRFDYLIKDFSIKNFFSKKIVKHIFFQNIGILFIGINQNILTSSTSYFFIKWFDGYIFYNLPSLMIFTLTYILSKIFPQRIVNPFSNFKNNIWKAINLTWIFIVFMIFITFINILGKYL